MALDIFQHVKIFKDVLVNQTATFVSPASVILNDLIIRTNRIMPKTEAIPMSCLDNKSFLESRTAAQLLQLKPSFKRTGIKKEQACEEGKMLKERGSSGR